MVPPDAQHLVTLQQLDAAIHIALPVHHVPHRQDLLRALSPERLEGPLQELILRVDIPENPDPLQTRHGTPEPSSPVDMPRR